MTKDDSVKISLGPFTIELSEKTIEKIINRGIRDGDLMDCRDVDKVSVDGTFELVDPASEVEEEKNKKELDD